MIYNTLEWNFEVAGSQYPIKCLWQPLKLLFKVNVGLSQMSWKAAEHVSTQSCCSPSANIRVPRSAKLRVFQWHRTH